MNLVCVRNNSIAARRWGWVIFAAGCLLGVIAPRAGAYVLSGTRWPDNQTIVLSLDFISPGKTLIDGSTTWDQVAEAAMDVWNPYLGSGVRLQADETPVTPAQLDGKNSVFFSQTIYGDAFGDDTIGITVSFHNKTTNVQLEADVLFNASKTFDSYRGARRYLPTGAEVYDLRRVAIHEFGHVLGLDHVYASLAIMLPDVTDLDTIQPDDIAGVRAIYEGADTIPIILSDLTGRVATDNFFDYFIESTGFAKSFNAGPLPPGMTVNTNTGEIRGYPTAAGVYNIVLSATNATGTGTAILHLNVEHAPVLTSPAKVSTQVGKPFYYQITADYHPIKYELYGVGLPRGLKLDETTGVISGTVLDRGSYSVGLEISNEAGTGGTYLDIEAVIDTAETVFHSFTGPDGATPLGSMILGSDGDFYGSTRYGGPADNNLGTIYKITPAGKLTTIYNQAAAAALFQAADGSIYALTQDPFPSIIRFAAAGGTPKVLHQFLITDLTNAYPAAFFQRKDGRLYLTAGPQIFELVADGTPKLFYASTFGVSSWMLASDGNFYGTAANGGSHSAGAIFKITPAGAFVLLHEFDYNGYSEPYSALTDGGDGYFYGSTTEGFANHPAVFKMTPGGTVTTLYVFGQDDGLDPSTLVKGADGKLYGLAGYGPADGGVLFNLTTGGEYTMVHAFTQDYPYNYALSSGTQPTGAPVQGADGEFYGGLQSGGINNSGQLFKTNLRVTVFPANVPRVTVNAATRRVAVGGGGKAVINVRLATAQTEDLVVRYTLKGSAKNGTDYASLSGSVKIKAGKTHKAVAIAPLGDLRGAASRKVKFAVAPDAGYVVVGPAAIKIKIVRDN